jgi:hypothetical protein
MLCSSVEETTMNRRIDRNLILTGLALAGLAIVLSGCAGAGAGGSGGGGGGTTCTGTGDYTVEWKFSGSYADSVSVATTWVKPTGEFSDPSDTKYASIDPTSGATLLTETLPACSGASINITGLDGGSDDTVGLSNVVLSIYVDGTLADSYSYSGPLGESEILPSSGALTVVVGQ